MDQSLASDSAALVQDIAARDARVRLVPDPRRGAARARNLGVASTRGEVVVFTDDDCEPDPEWLARLIRVFEKEPKVGIAFGSVLPGPHDARDGFIVGFIPGKQRRLSGRLSKLRDSGISANVALRRSALAEAMGFDEMLGPGSYFPCAEDFDLTYRVLASGYTLLHVPDAQVVHHGLRDWRSGRRLVRQTYVAIGAAYMKYVRMCDFVGVLLLAEEVGLAIGNILTNLARRRGPFGFGRLAGLLLGAWRSFELEVDSHRRLIRPASRNPPTLVNQSATTVKSNALAALSRLKGDPTASRHTPRTQGRCRNPRLRRRPPRLLHELPRRP